MSEINAGDKVRFTDEYLHIMQPRYYPAPGTVGEVVAKHPRTGEVCVQWPAGSTSRSDMWWCSAGNLELVQKGESNEREQ